MLRLRLPAYASGLAVPLLGGLATIATAYATVRIGPEVGVGAVLGAAAFLLTVVGFVAYPHVAVSGTIVLFSLIPTLKVFVAAEAGVLKDAVVLAAVVAAVIVVAFARRPVDRVVLVTVGLLLALYVINVGGSYGIAWAQGVRLFAEPILLLLVGLALPTPRRTLRTALATLVLVGCAVAAYGLVQQVVGKFTLVEWGYSFDSQVRSLYSGQLRSFGTLDDPFTYASLLLLALAAVLFWLRRGGLAWAAGLLLLAGIVVSFSRAAALVLVAFGALALARRGYPGPAVLAAAAVSLIGVVLLVGASGTESRPVPTTPAAGGAAAGSANVILNGRISAWEAAVGDEPSQWILGRGVGEVGTAAERSTYSFEAPAGEEGTGVSESVDSGYLATLADVGILGLAVLLALLARLLWLSREVAAKGANAGWFALAALIALLLDALTRASFTGFPAAYLTMLLVGVALAAAAAPASQRPRAAP